MAEGVRERLTRQGNLQPIPIDKAAEARLLADAQLHLQSAEAALQVGDLAGAYQLLYDAARKSVTALIAREGLRVRGLGAHAHAVELAAELLSSQSDASVLRPLDRLRRTRNQAEYDGRSFDEEEVRDDLTRATAIVIALATRLDRAGDDQAGAPPATDA